MSHTGILSSALCSPQRSTYRKSESFFSPYPLAAAPAAACRSGVQRGLAVFTKMPHKVFKYRYDIRGL